jgi:thiol-disulfide isomerase/thioredoxin
VAVVATDMSAGAWVVVGAVALAVTFGCYRLLTDGRFRGTRVVSSGESVPPRPPAARTPWSEVQASLPEARLGGQATLVQFSSAFCAPCRATRRTLSEVAAVVPGVEHLEIDAEHHLDLVRRLDVTRTPTTIVLDASGHEVTRAAGAPRKEQVIAALGRA